jgi:putative ABC transport system ATP-binding protein
MTGTAATMKIDENLALAKRRGKSRGLRWGVTAQEREEYKERLKILDLGLENRLTAKVGLLSGGQRQALTLLMATLVPPKILLLDEHTAALDPQAAEKIMDLTKQITQENNTTCLMVTHNLKQAVSIGNRTLMMANGHIVVDITGEDRKDLTIQDLMRMFREQAGKEFDNDRILLSE